MQGGLSAKFGFCAAVIFSMAALVTVSALYGDSLSQVTPDPQ